MIILGRLRRGIQRVLEQRRHAARGWSTIQSGPQAWSSATKARNCRALDEDAGGGEIALFAGLLQAPLRRLFGLLVFVRHGSQRAIRPRAAVEGDARRSARKSAGKSSASQPSMASADHHL